MLVLGEFLKLEFPMAWCVTAMRASVRQSRGFLEGLATTRTFPFCAR